MRDIHIERNLDTQIKIQRYLEKKAEQTAILFADMADSTRYKAERSIYAGLAKTRDHNLTISEIIKNNRGRVVKWIGDAVMGRFDLIPGGADPHDAINAAISIQEEFSGRNRRLAADLEKFRTRIGIGVGPTANFLEDDPQGLAVDEAARIQALCKPEQILIHENLKDMADVTRISSQVQKTKGATPSSLFGDPVERHFKGIGSPVPVIEVIWGEKPLGIDREDRKLSREEKDLTIRKLLARTDLFAPKGLRFRANIMMIDEAQDKIVIPRGLFFNMEKDGDRNIALPIGDGCTGRAFNQKNQVFADKRETIFKLVESEMEKVPVRLKFILSTPIFDADDKSMVIGVYNIDGFRLLKSDEISNLRKKATLYAGSFAFLL
jgi:class 3 adenylate cyclase